MKIVWFIDSLGMGGAERLLPPYLQTLRSHALDIRVCTFQVRQGNPIARHLEALGLPVDLLPIANLRDLTAIPRLYRYLGHHRPQLVHTQLEFANTLATLAARLRRLPSLSTLHTIDPLTGRDKQSRRLRLMWRVLGWGAKRLIAVSEGVRRHYIAHFPALAGRFLTLYNGIELERFRPRPETERLTYRQRYQLPPTTPILLTVAVLRQPKGIQYLLQALPAIRQALPETRYVVVGGGDYEAPLKQLAHELGVAEQVLFAGSQDNIPEWLALSDLFVLPTLDDALPTVLMEAMAAGLPIIASAVGGVPEMVTDGQNGLLLRPGQPTLLAEQTIALLANPTLRHQLGQNGRLIAQQRFNLATQAQTLTQLYLRVMSDE